MLPSGNLFPDSFDEIGFVNRGGGDYRLAARSRYRNAATGGGAPGADVTDSSLRGMPRARAPQGSFSRRPVDTVRFERLERDEEDAAAAPAEAVRAAAALGPPVPPGARARPRGRRPWRSARFAERL
jgi:hypothetical protein